MLRNLLYRISVRIRFTVGYLFKLLFALVGYLPKCLQQALIIIMLRLYWIYHEYLGLIISIYHDNTSPKHIYGWGMHSFFNKYINSGMTVLDIGCGDGSLSKSVSQKANKVIAYDINLRNIAAAKEKNHADNIEYFVGDAREFLPQGRYDAVILSSILTFINDRNLFLNRLHEVTNTLLIRETRYDNDYVVLLSREFGVKKSPYYEYTKEEIVSKLTEAGWAVTDSWDTYDIFLRAQDMHTTEH